MKWIALALLIIAVPLLTIWLRSNPRQVPFLWGLLGMLPFVINPWRLSVAPYPAPLWSGYVKGGEFTLLDAVALAIILGSRGRWPKIYFLVPLGLYLFAVLIGVFQADFWQLSSSYLIQMVRVSIVMIAVARVTATEQGQRAVLTGLIFGLAIQAGYAIAERAGGALQTGGSLGHQNLLGFVSHMAVMPALALFLAGRYWKTALLGVMAGLIVIVLTASRATIAAGGFGLFLTLILSLLIRFTGRKILVGAAGLVLILASLPFAQASFERRFQQQGTTFFAEDLERQAFARAAWTMISDHPLGVGPNHYVFVANTEGYNDGAGVAWGSGSRSTSVHNAYLLVLAENGIYGLGALLALLLAGIYRAFSSAWRYRRQQGSEVLIGSGCALIAICLHSFLEWMLVLHTVQYLLAVTLGLISGLIVSLSRSHSLGPVRRQPAIGPIGAAAVARAG